MISTKYMPFQLLPYQPLPGEHLPPNIRGVGDLRYRTAADWKRAGQRYAQLCGKCHTDPGFVYEPALVAECNRRMLAGTPPLLALEAYSCPHGHVVNAERALILGADVWTKQNKRRTVPLLLVGLPILFLGLGGLILLAFPLIVLMAYLAWSWRDTTGAKRDAGLNRLAGELNQHPEYPGMWFPNSLKGLFWWQKLGYWGLTAQPWLDPAWQMKYGTGTPLSQVQDR